VKEITLHRRGMLIVVSSPSGGGKSTVIKEILKKDPAMEYSVSVTSRSPRPGEVPGESYHFTTKEQFQKWIEEGRFYEWAHVHNHLYGTRREVIEEKLVQGKDVIMDLDFQGGLSVKKQSPNAVLIFLLPPTMKVLENRLRKRKTDDDKVIQLRLKNAREEIRYAKKYDYILINNDLQDTINKVRGIIEAERYRAVRQEMTLPED